MEVKTTRQFLGKTENFKDKQEKTFNQRMLNAYLKGCVYFHYGYEHMKSLNGIKKRMPKRYLVLQD